ncbi:ArsR/SmtB family transcription factor [Salinigranum rubrum]|uniref:ArsR/SmtB family transcription factor n=1 Tax=Salinigranum rubrum TaxID=755307 RepID=UPI001FEB8DF0|nr:winged helix-turn-helix domain-containing protein [Salinigranum rubrum]
MLESLAPETARKILSTLADRPATASDVADRVDTSVQNAHYHLSKLRDADLVTDAGTWYSSKGKEMTVYALTSNRLELRIGTGESATSTPTDRLRAPNSPSCNTTGD